MPKSVNEVFRDFVRWTGDGLPNEPTGHPLPIGDPRSGIHNPTKADFRDALGGVWLDAERAEDARNQAEEAAEAAQEAMTDTQGATLFAASLSSLLANVEPSYPAGTVFMTRAEGFSYEVVSSGAHLTTAGGVGLRVLPDARGEYPLAAMGLAFNKSTDISAKLQTLGQYVATRGGGTIALPAGDMLIAAPVNIVMPIYNASLHSGFESVYLRGAGRYSTRVYIGAGVTTDFAVTVTRSYSKQRSGASGFSLIPLAPIDGTPNYGALRFASVWTTASGGWGVQHAHQVAVFDIAVENEDVSGTTGYIRNGLRIDWAFHPKVLWSTFKTRTQWVRTDDKFAEGHGVEFYNCYLPELQASHVNGRFLRSVIARGDQNSTEANVQDFEGFKVWMCTFDGEPEWCIELRHENQAYRETVLKEVGCDIMWNHIDGARGDVLIGHHKQIKIKNNKIYLTQPSYDFGYRISRGIQLEACKDFEISGNSYYQDGMNNGAGSALGAQKASAAAGTSASMNTNLNAQSSIMTITFTTPAADPSATPGQVIFETGGSAQGVALVYQNDRRLALYCGTGAATPRLLTSFALAASTQYTAVIEIDQAEQMLALHVKKAAASGFWFVGRTAEALLRGFAETTIVNANATGVGQINDTCGGYNGAVSGTTNFAGAISGLLRVYSYAAASSDCILIDEDCRNGYLVNEAMGTIGVGVRSFVPQNNSIIHGDFNYGETWGGDPANERGPNFRVVDATPGTMRMQNARPVGAKITRSADQSIANATWVSVRFDGVSDEEVATIWDVSAPEQIVVPSWRGYTQARITIKGAFDANATGLRQVRVTRAGTEGVFGPFDVRPAYSGDWTRLAVEGLWQPVSDGDVLRVQVQQNSGGALALKHLYAQVEFR